jgi:hypothetical protein
LYTRKSFSWLYHILSDYFKPYNNLLSLTRYILHPTFVFGTDILSVIFMYMSESSDPYKYAVRTSINCKHRRFYVTIGIRYRKVISFIIGEYVSLKSMLCLFVNPCTTSLALYLTTSLFSFYFRMKTYLNPTRWIIGGVVITLLNTSLFLSESCLASIASFHLIQSKRYLHSDMVLGSGSLRRSTTMDEKHKLTTIVVWSNNSLELV